MLPCEYVQVSLVSIGSRKHPLDHFAGVAPGPVQDQTATVFHLEDYCDDSYVDVTLVRNLYRAKHGAEAKVPYIDKDTRVVLQWHYLPLDETEVTTHAVVRNSRYQIILRKQDWERPIRCWLQEACQREHQQQRDQQSLISQQETQQKAEEARQSPTTLSNPEYPQINGTSPPIIQEDEEESEFELEWSDVEIIESEPSEGGAVEKDSNAFWTWSREHKQWFHKNEDQTVMWLPQPR